MLKSKLGMALVSIFITICAGVTYADQTQGTGAKSTETTGQYIKDSTITTKIKADLLADSDISSMHISVKTMKHVVTLTGHVDTAEQKEKADKIAKDVEGVKRVKNHLVVTEKKSQ